jgi:hypothetical protein
MPGSARSVPVAAAPMLSMIAIADLSQPGVADWHPMRVPQPMRAACCAYSNEISVHLNGTVDLLHVTLNCLRSLLHRIAVHLLPSAISFPAELLYPGQAPSFENSKLEGAEALAIAAAEFSVAFLTSGTARGSPAQAREISLAAASSS